MLIQGSDNTLKHLVVRINRLLACDTEIHGNAGRMPLTLDKMEANNAKRPSLVALRTSVVREIYYES